MMRTIFLTLFIAAITPFACIHAAESQVKIVPDRIYVDSDKTVLADEMVEKCISGVGRGYGIMTSRGIAYDVSQFKLESALETLIFCRRSLQRFPAEPSVLTYHAIASAYVSVALLGFSAPVEEAARVELLVNSIGGDMRKRPDIRTAAGTIYLGTAYAFGIGVKRDLEKAEFYYRLGGDRISVRELAEIVRERQQ
jgi:hypothetical protein